MDESLSILREQDLLPQTMALLRLVRSLRSGLFLYQVANQEGMFEGLPCPT